MYFLFFKAHSMWTVYIWHILLCEFLLFSPLAISFPFPLTIQAQSDQGLSYQSYTVISNPAWYFEIFVQSKVCRYGPERPIVFHAYTGLNLTASVATGAQPPNSHYLLLFCFVPCKFEIPWWGCVGRSCFLLLQSTTLSMQYVSLH